MKILNHYLMVAASMAGSGVCQQSNAQAIIDGSTVTFPQAATQDVILPLGTPFNPEIPGQPGQEVVLTVTAVGESTFTVDLSSGSLELVDGSFNGFGFDSALGNFELKTGPANGFEAMTVEFNNFSGDLATGEFTADVVEFEVPNFGVALLDAGVELEVVDPFFFTGGTFDGLPPSAGITLRADPFDGDAAQLSVSIAGGGPFVGFSSSRLVTTLPEPGAALLMMSAAGAVLARRR